MPKLIEEVLGGKPVLRWEPEPVDPDCDGMNPMNPITKVAYEREERFRVYTLNTLWSISQELRDIADAIRESKGVR